MLPPEQIRPWSDDDYQRDLTRAENLSISHEVEAKFTRDEWAASAADGHDLVGDAMAEADELKLTTLQASRQAQFEHGREAELDRRKTAREGDVRDGGRG